MKHYVLIYFLSVYTINLYANDCINCSPELKPFKDIEKSISELQEPTVIKCDDKLAKEASENYQLNFKNSPQKIVMIHGLKLKGSVDEINIVTKMLGTKPLDAFKNAKDCQTILCATSAVFGSEEAAQRALNIAKRDGYIVSMQKDFLVDGKYEGQAFNLKELRYIDLAFKNLPINFKKLNSLNRLKRMPNGKSRSDLDEYTAAYASPKISLGYYNTEGEITFLEAAFDADESWGPLVAVHELTHHVDFSRSSTAHGYSTSKEFLELSGWKLKNIIEKDKQTGKLKSITSWDRPKDKKFVRDYAGTSPHEDFAESTAYYVFNPYKLKSIDPKKYDYIKNNIFNGKEYNLEKNYNISPDDVVNECVAQTKIINLFRSFSYPRNILKSSCIENFFKTLKYTDEVQCMLNKDQVKYYFNDILDDKLQEINNELLKCEKNLDQYNQQCLDDGDLTKDCSINKCNLSPIIKNKTKEESFNNFSKDIFIVLDKKIGRSNFIAQILISGLMNKKNAYQNYNLVYQDDFLENSLKNIPEMLSKNNIKFEKVEDIQKNVAKYLLFDEKMNKSFEIFQKNVLSKSTKNKEENLRLIKQWAENLSLDDSVYFDELAQTLTK